MIDSIHVQVAAVGVASVSAMFALITYQRNAHTRTAEFLMELHQAFFVDGTYKEVRKILDDHSASSHAKIVRLINEESDEFTSFLNFFELVAYMSRRSGLFAIRTLAKEDVEALLGYYLQLLTDQRDLYEYIKNEKHGFEHLRNLLKTRTKAMRKEIRRDG